VPGFEGALADVLPISLLFTVGPPQMPYEDVTPRVTFRDPTQGTSHTPLASVNGFLVSNELVCTAKLFSADPAIFEGEIAAMSAAPDDDVWFCWDLDFRRGYCFDVTNIMDWLGAE